MSERPLKEQALLERIAELVTSYEDKDAERRVQITQLVQRLNDTEAQVTALNQIIEQHNADNEVVEGEVVEEEDSTDESS